MCPTEIDLHEHQTTITRNGTELPITVYYAENMGIQIKTVSDESGEFVSLDLAEQDKVIDEICDNSRGIAV